MTFAPRLLLLVSVASAVWLGRPSSALADCKVDKQCKSPRICDSGTCREPQCATDVECSAGQACERGRCAAARKRGCKSDVDCPGTQLCIEAACKADQACKSDVDCPGAQVCSASRCRAGGKATTALPLAAVPVAPAPAGTDAPPGAAPPPAAYAPPGTYGPPAADAPPDATAGRAPLVLTASAGAVGPDEKTGKSQAKTMFIGAGVLFGAAYLLSLPITAASSSGSATAEAAIPIAGPMVILANHSLTPGGIAYYAADTACQLGSLVLVGLGIRELVKHREGDAAVRVSTVAPDGRGPGIGIGFDLP